MVEASAADPADEWVVLLAEDGEPRGQALKSDVHTTTTPLHLAFSCWVFDASGRTLLTQRAHTKRTWPGAWTNTVCGHPAPGEPIADAVRRRASYELGIDLTSVDVVLPDFRYRAEMPDGTVENEVCPVYTAVTAAGDLIPNASEVADTRWISIDALRRAVSGDPAAYSPWMLEQFDLLVARSG